MLGLIIRAKALFMAIRPRTFSSIVYRWPIKGKLSHVLSMKIVFFEINHLHSSGYREIITKGKNI